ncbi:hypothetical protein AaE_009204 [Aphanomyces astaci]|uniref:Uncharacterized protein n=3 Tax=Aphanomyces astaci TaxID=112090 RepID=A0A6A5A5E0_APHAT|nr:hypothetical protein AaE_009204 [Aphanomyces astaci]
MGGDDTVEFHAMGLFDKETKFGLDPRWLRRNNNLGYEHQLNQIKDVLKTHDTQHNLFPLAFYRHVKPPVSPPEKFRHRPEMVAGKKVPFTVAMATRGRHRMTRLGAIPEGENKDACRTCKRKPSRHPRMIRVGNSFKLIA